MFGVGGRSLLDYWAKVSFCFRCGENGLTMQHTPLMVGKRTAVVTIHGCCPGPDVTGCCYRGHTVVLDLLLDKSHLRTA
jgi:hypothetical protein